MIIGIDHILIAVDDLNTAYTAFQRLGFDVAIGGEHPRAGTQNALISLADGSYLELVKVKDPLLAQHVNFANHVLQALTSSHRLTYFALDSNELLTDVSAICARGLAMEEVAPGARRRPDGQEVQWQMVNCVDHALPFLIQDITPRSTRVPTPSLGLGAKTKLMKLVWQTPLLAQRLQQLEQLLSQTPIKQQFQLQRGKIELVIGKEECLREVLLETTDLVAVTKQWRAEGITFKQNSNYYEIAEQETCGAKLVFK